MIRIHVLLVALVLPSIGTAQPSGLKSPFAPETVLRAQDALRVLGFELTMMERETLPGIKNPALRESLRTHVNKVQVSVAGLEQSLLPGGKALVVHKRYTQVDSDLHELIDTIDGSEFRTLALAQSSKRLGFIDSHLGDLLSRGGGEGGDELFPVVLRRQAHALEEAAKDLYELSKEALPPDVGGQRTRESLRKLKIAAGVFSDRLDFGDSLPLTRKSYFGFDRAWQRAAGDVNALPPPQSHRLSPAAHRVDHLHGRLINMLKIEESGHYLIKDGDDKIRNKLAQLQGTWFVVSDYRNGKRFGEQDPNNIIVFSGNRWFRQDNGVLGAHGVVRVVEVGAEASKLEMTQEGQAPNPVLVQIKGDLMRYAHFSSGAVFPNTFQSMPADDMLSVVWRRR